jgi:predicted MPP superfamily phosphohydrolase
MGDIAVEWVAMKNSWLEISEVRVTLPRLAAGFNGYRLVQISDIHYGTWINQARLDYALDLVNRQHPDMIAITGDFVTYDPAIHASEIVQSLHALHASDGVLAVMGNHDHWTDADGVARILAASGIENLNNSVLSVQRGPSVLHFAGVDCSYERKDRLDIVLEALPDGGAAILLVHEPDFADISAGTGRFDMQISGHSHGGQIKLPFLRAPILPPHARKYPHGRYQINGMVQYTNRGLGTTSLRLRMWSPAEITVFTLVAPD